ISCTKDCKALFAKGTKVTLTAKASAGSAIDDWPNDQCQEQGTKLSYDGPTCTVVMDSDKSLSVYFTTVTLLVYFSGDDHGTVTSSPPGISCTKDCKALFAKGTTVTLTAKPSAGFALDDWPNDQCKEQGTKLSYNGPECTVVL